MPPQKIKQPPATGVVRRGNDINMDPQNNKGVAPLPAEDQYKPSFMKKLTGVNFAGVNPFRSQASADIHANVRYDTIKVWSDGQHKMVSAREYLQETEPVEMDTIDHTVKNAVESAGAVIDKNVSRKYGESKVRGMVINSTIARTPVIGKLLGKAAGAVAGIDVTMMGDATIEGARNRDLAAERNRFDQLAIHWKRGEVQAAVHGRAYEPNFLMGLSNVRKVTDAMQDFTQAGGNSLVDGKALDESEAGVAYREAMWMGNKDAAKNYRNAISGKLGKAAINYDAKKEGLNVA